MPLEGWYNSTSVTTDTLNTLLPGIKTKYGAGVPVYMLFNVQSIADITVAEKNQVLGGEITLDISFYPTPTGGASELAASLTLKDTKFGFTVLVDNMTLSMHVDHLNVNKIVVNTDNIGGLKPFLMKTAFNTAMLVAIPIANGVLANHTLTIPDHLTQFF